MGLLLGIIVDQQTSTRRDTGAYRIPMAVQFVFPIILVPGLLLFAPESPRWLLEKNKDAKATRALRKLIGPNHEDEIILETESIQQTIETYEYGSSSWESVFKWGPEGRKAYLGASLQGMKYSWSSL
jgi:SP family sugar:H+ symporter-like MFS transporter